MNEMEVRDLLYSWNEVGLPSAHFMTSDEYPDAVYMNRDDMHQFMQDIIHHVRKVGKL